MSDELLKYYNRELAFLRHMGAEFSQRHPKVAGNLRISEERVEDPHVSRLLEGVSLLTAQIRQKLDDSFPELTEALMGQLYPDYHAPIPSMNILKMSTQNVPDYSFHIPKGTEVETMVRGYKECKFKTCYDTTMWPIEITEATMESAPFKAPKPKFQREPESVIKLRFTCEFPETEMNKLGIESLRLHLSGLSQVSYELYQLLLKSAVGLAFASPNSSEALRYLPPRHLSSVGFSDNEKVVPYTEQSFNGYRLLVEHFLCPEKFLFVELNDLSAECFGQESEVDLYIYLDKSSDLLVKQLTHENILLGCVPIINLFEADLEPIRLDPSNFEHRLVPRFSDADVTEVVKVLDVEAFDQHDNFIPVTPFYGSYYSHHPHAHNIFWTIRRELSQWAGGHDEPGMETYLSVVDGNSHVKDVDVQNQWVVSIKAMCSNRNLAARLPVGANHPKLIVRDFPDSLKSITCLGAFSEPIRPLMFDASRWQLISHLTLNHFNRPDAAVVLKELLRLYDFKHSAQTEILIKAIGQVKIKRATSRIVQSGRVGFCHGSDIYIEFANSDVAETSLFLFGSVLAHFFAQYATVNSFTRLNISLKGRAEPIHRWPEMTGTKELI
ncbi:type VI secretion system baseplate subunit TssF [Vibrio atypicus]|uniref:type VI secretion system baseplate subunit TssF n=1 Tax=Vibrio atypicus TaxID=558271 RepID=UPI003735A139